MFSKVIPATFCHVSTSLKNALHWTKKPTWQHCVKAAVDAYCFHLMFASWGPSGSPPPPCWEGSNFCSLLKQHQFCRVILHHKAKEAFATHWFITSNPDFIISDLEEGIKFCSGSELTVCQLYMKLGASLIACWTIVKVVTSSTLLVMLSRTEHTSYFWCSWV